MDKVMLISLFMGALSILESYIFLIIALLQKKTLAKRKIQYGGSWVNVFKPNFGGGNL